MEAEQNQPAKSPFREIIEPFVNVVKAPRALWGINLVNLFEGMCYFGILTLLAMYFNQNVGLDDARAGWIVGAFTGGITLAMFFFGELADRWGVRVALILALALMFLGRILLTSAGSFGGSGMWSPVFFASAGGLLLVILGYGMFQPASYSAIRQFTTKETAAMGYAMLYALMNLGGFLPGIISPPIRNAFGITGIFWVYTAFTLISMFAIIILLTKKTVLAAQFAANPEKEQKQKAKKVKVANDILFEQWLQKDPERAGRSGSFSFFVFRMGRWLNDHPLQWLREHPLRDVRFAFFIFILIPVQTLFAHQWLTMPQYVDRAFPGFVSQNMETFVNLNPILIFVLTPMVAAFTSKVNVYKMMILGTLVMAIPTFLLATGPNVIVLLAYILLMSVGEAMWQPRFLQLAAELAPEGKTGQYMGIAQFPWFLTKLVTSTYSGYMLSHYCPKGGAQNTETMWLIYGLVALISPIALFLAKDWIGNRLETA